MSVSMDKDPPDAAADSRSDLATWLDNYAAGRCDRAQMQASFLEICRSNPEAPWDALALLDQYQRRGRIDAALARSLKSDIAQLVFGVVDQTEDTEDAEELKSPREPQPTPAPADSTGTRWRKLMVEREEPAAPARRDNSFVDPLQFGRDVEPLTRPPPVPPKPRQPAPQDGTASGSILRERYELLTILGRGNGGTVYKALDRHRSHLDPADRCVAVRVLKLNHRDSPQTLAELEQQFHQAQLLAHPNIVSVHDLDRDGATYFMVMELLDGELLTEVLDRLDHRPMAKDRALSIIGGIGAALAYAHRRGVPHGDLKPGSIMLAADGEVKVMDFGFVRRQHADARRSEPWIGDAPIGGAPFGGAAPSSTFAYASQERVNSEAPQESDDVYSLACVAYELLSGHHPFGGRSATLARAQGRAPQRIKGLTHKQWSALQTGLRWDREDRRIDVTGLIAGLGCMEVLQRFAASEQIVARQRPARSATPYAVFLVTLLLLGAAAFAYWKGYLRIPAIDAQSVPTVAVEAPGSLSEPSPEGTVEPAPQASTETGVVPEANRTAPATPPVSEPAPADLKQAPTATNENAASVAAAPAPTAPARGGPSRIAFDKDTYVATESDGSVRLVVRRTGNLRSAASFQWALLPNSAVAGEDFAAIGPGIEQFKPGASTVTLTIPLVSDAIKESTELFLVELRSIDNSTELGELARAAVLIVDDD